MIYYIGSFPPEFGGVTIKNKNLYETLEKEIRLKKVDLNLVKRGNIREMLRLVWALRPGNQYLLGVAGQKNRRNFTKLMYRFKRKAMGRSVMFVMAGVVSDMIEAGPEYLMMASGYRKIYVELPAMARALEAAGLSNVSVYPNGRPEPDHLPPVVKHEGPLRCVFFSRIQPEKGVDRVLEAAKRLPGMVFHFYGEFEPTYEQRFREEIAARPNAEYRGVFRGGSDAVYRELSGYDLLLLPTRCKTEGLPGILIEAKIAGIPSVVTDLNSLGEIVTDSADGIVLEADTADCLITALEALDADRENLQRMKQESRISARRYYIESYIPAILRELEKR